MPLKRSSPRLGKVGGWPSVTDGGLFSFSASDQVKLMNTLEICAVLTLVILIIKTLAGAFFKGYEMGKRHANDAKKKN